MEGTRLTPEAPAEEPVATTDVHPDDPYTDAPQPDNGADGEARELSPMERVRDDLRAGRISPRDALLRLLDTVVGDQDAYADEAENG